MLVTLDGIVTSPFTPAIRVLPSFDSNKPFTDEYLALPPVTVIDISPLQPLNAELSMFVTLDGIVTLVRPLQP